MSNSILFVAPLPPPLTGQSIAADAARADLLQRGHVLRCVNLSKQSFVQGADSLRRVLEILGVAWLVWRQRDRCDVVYLTTAESVAGNLKDMVLLALLGRHRRRAWLHLHGGAGMRVLLSEGPAWLRRLNRAMLRDVAGIVVLGQRLASIFDGYLPPERLRVVKNFAADDLFLSGDELAGKWNAVGSGAVPLRVLFLSNHLPGKGHEELLGAIQRLPDHVRERVRFDFAGGFETDAARRDFLGRLAGCSHAQHHGLVTGEAKRRLLAQAHVFCLPTCYPYEGQPISILEAYASGCAVITTDHSGIFDIFEPGRQGLEVPVRDPAALAGALTRLSSDLPAARVMAEFNRTEAASKYTRARHLGDLRRAIGLEPAA